MSFEIGQTVGGYQIMDVLDTFGFGVVTTEIIEGISLEQRLKKGPIPLTESLEWVS